MGKRFGVNYLASKPFSAYITKKWSFYGSPQVSLFLWSFIFKLRYNPPFIQGVISPNDEKA